MSDTPPVPSGRWFNQVAKFLGPAYLRNAFTKRSDRRTRSITGNLCASVTLRSPEVIMSADFDEAMGRARAALGQIVNGNPDGYKSLYSRRPDITLGNPFGGFGRGEAAVFEQLERAAAHYRDGEAVEFETVSQLVEGDLAYTVEVERFRAKVGGRSNLSDLALRVTCIYRREEGEWKLVHRHGDPRVDRQPAESVIQN